MFGKMFLCIAFTFMFCFCARADSYVNYQKTGVLSVYQVNQREKRLFGDSSLPAATSSVVLYKVKYKSTNMHGRAVVLSGLFALPKNGAPNGLVLYDHSTMWDRRESPSRYNGKNDASDIEDAAIAFASGGYAVVMPDYLGLGDDPGVHPFPLGSVNCLSGIDMVVPCRTVAKGRKTYVSPRLFVAGYSEGGAVAMWTVRTLENKPIPGNTLTAAAPMSGPYDMSGVTAESFERSTRDPKILGARLFLLSYMGYSYQKNVPGVQLGNYFTHSFATYVPYVFKQRLTIDQAARKLEIKGIEVGTLDSVRRALTSRFWNAMKTKDMTDPLLRELRQNNCNNWKPHTKMLMICLDNDTIVVPENTEETLANMRANGAGSNVVRDYVIHQKDLNHVTSSDPALVLAREFFDTSGKS